MIWPWGRVNQSCTILCSTTTNFCLYLQYTSLCQSAYLCLLVRPIYFGLSPSGFHGLCISAVLLLLLVGLGAPLGYLFELLLPLAVCAIAVSFLLSIYLYVRSFWAPTHALALGGNTGESGGSLWKDEFNLKHRSNTAPEDILCIFRLVTL